jgi:C4-dicarboxylate transporter DctM subunit
MVAAIGTILIPAMVKVDASVDFAVVMFIIAFASVFAWVLATSHFATDLPEKLLSITSNKRILLLLINGILFLSGCFIDAASANYIFLPIMLPVIRQLGVAPIVFGVFMTMNLAIRMRTPPIVLALVTFIPTLSLWLPNLMGIKQQVEKQ